MRECSRPSAARDRTEIIDASFFMRSLIAGQMLAPNCARTEPDPEVAAAARHGKPQPPPTRAMRRRRCCSCSRGPLSLRRPEPGVTDTIHVTPARAEGGLIHARLMRAMICACQRAASSLLRTALPRSSASRLRRNSASRATPRLFFGGLLRRGGIIGLLLLARLLVRGGLFRCGLLGGRLGRGLFLSLERSALRFARPASRSFCSCLSLLPRASPARASPARGVPLPACVRSPPDRAWAAPAPRPAAARAGLGLRRRGSGAGVRTAARCS